VYIRISLFGTWKKEYVSTVIMSLDVHLREHITEIVYCQYYISLWWTAVISFFLMTSREHWAELMSFTREPSVFDQSLCINCQQYSDEHLLTVTDRGRPALSKPCWVHGWDTMKGILQNHVYVAAGILVHRPYAAMLSTTFLIILIVLIIIIEFL